MTTRALRYWSSCAVFVLLTANVGMSAAGVSFDDKLTEFDYLLLGLTVKPEPPSQVVPRNTATGIRIELAFSDVNADAAGLLSLLPSGIEVVAELVGPGIASPIELRGPPGDFLPIPPIERKGVFLVRDIRLEKDGSVFLRGSPDTATVEVIDRVLVTQVTTRPLTLEEIRQKGILFGDDSFTGFNFTLALRLDSRPVTIDFPVVFDSNDIPVPISATGSLDLQGQTLPIVNTGIIPVMMTPNIPAAQQADILPLLPDIRIPGLIVIPGDVGFLNQFFSALLLVSNGSPLTSGLSVRALDATIELPPGDDGVGDTGDDPLLVAETQTGGQAFVLPIRGLGGDGEPGTGDDTSEFNPGEQGQAEFLLEGRREGFHEIRFDIAGTLDGLPIGPVPITGVARGGVLVRNPTFNLTFVAPATVRAGEEFSLFVTATNVSDTAANLVTVRLDPTQISGATLVSTPPPPIPTLNATDSELLEFRFVSQTTGQVSASYLNVEQGTGDLLFRMGVGERGVPLSPETIVLPQSVEALPSDVVNAALRALGAGWSVATAPNGTLAEGVLRVSKQTVLDRASALAEAGFRVQMGEPLELALQNVAFNWAQTSDPGFEQLLRETKAGTDFFDALGPSLGVGGTISEIQRDASLALAGLSSNILVGVGDGAGGEAPVDWSLEDAAGRELDPDGFGTLANAVFLPTSSSPSSSGRGLGLATRLGSSLYEWRFTSTATAPASFDLAVSLPRSDGGIARHTFSGVTTGPGESGRLSLDLLGSAGALTLEIDRDGDGIFEDVTTQSIAETLPIPPPTLLAATSIGPETLTSADPFGRVVALLFSRPMREAEVLDVSRYGVEANGVISSSLQLSGRLAFLFLEAPVSDLIARDVTVSGLFDATGIPLPASTQTIGSLLEDAGGVVSGRVLNADGTPVPNAEVLYINSVPGNVVGIAQKTVDAQGGYQFDWVRRSPNGPFSMRATDPATGSVQQLTTSVGFDGESIVVDLVLLGRGGVTGIVRDSLGAPVPNAQVLVTSEVDPASFALVESDGEGRYTATGIVVGPLTVKAVLETSSGLAFGNLQRAGTFTAVDVNINLAVGTVSGRVFDSFEGVETPVADIQVYYLVPDGTGAREFVAATSKTDASGQYAFVDVPVPIGSFRVLAIDRVRSRQASTPGTFGPGQSLIADHDVFFFFDDFGSIEVTVHDPTGQPVGAGLALVTVAGRQLLTDASGKARFDQLTAGLYPVSARGAGSSRSVTATATVSEAALTNVNLQLAGTGRIVVTVLDEAGAPLPNHPVFRTVGSPCAGEQVITDGNGVAAFEDVPLGNATVKSIKGADLATVSTVIQRAGDERALILRFSGFGTVTGTVVDANGPFFGANVVLASRRLEPAFCTFVSDGAAQQVRTGLDGAFTFENVPLGAFTVSASEPTFFPVPASVSDVLLTPGATKTFELELISNIAGELSGTLFLPDGTTPAGSGVRVTASGPGRPDVTVVTNADSRYAFAEIFPRGKYTLTASDLATGKVARETVYLLQGQDLVKDLRLLGRSSVEVSVRKGDGTPVENAFVELKGAAFPFDVAAGNITPFDNGKLVFPRISEGNFAVTASDSFSRGGRASGAVTEDGVLTRVTVNVSVTGRVTGTFFAPNGSDPIPNAEVILRQGSTGRLLGSTTSSSMPGEVGTFAFEFVPAGTVLATATDPLTGRIGEASGVIETEGESLDLPIVALGLGTVSGTVTSGGVPSPAANVEITSSTGLSSSIANLRATATAGAAGEFVFEGVPVGSFTVKATLPGVSPLTGSTSGNITAEGEDVADLEVALEASGSVVGEVRRANDVDSVAGAALTMRPSKGTFRGQSNAAGAYRFDFVPTGELSVTAEETGGPDAGIATGTLVEGDTLTVDVVFNGTGSVSGTALDSDGSVLSAGRVRLTRPTPFPRDQVTTVASDGAFTFLGVPVGDYNLSLSVDGSPLKGSAMGNVGSDGAADTIVIQLAPATSVDGVVVKPDGSGGNVPAANVVVTVTGGNVFLSALTSASGAFSIGGVPEGSFAVKAQDPLSGGLATASAVIALPDPPPFPPLDVGELVLDLEPIQVDTIAPAPGATLIPPDADIVVTFTDPVVPASVPGRFFVSSDGSDIAGTPTVSPDGFTLTFDAIPYLPPSTVIDVLVDELLADTFGRRLGADFTSNFTTGGAVVTGRITNVGAPVDGADVTLTAASGSSNVLTGAEGRFRFDNVSSGTVTLVATSAGLTGSRVLDVDGAVGVLDTGDIPVQLVASISGQILEFDGAAPSDTLEVRVTQGASTVGFATTLAGGDYSVDNVPLGSFTLDVTNPVNGDRGRRTGTLASGGLAGFDVSLNGVGDLLVVVEDGNAQRLEGVQVTMSLTLFGATRVDNGLSDVNGEVLFVDVAFGSVSLSALDPATSISTASTATAAPGATVTLVLEPPGTVSGIVTAPGGSAAVSGAIVRVVRESGNVLKGEDTTDSGGAYSVTDIAPSASTHRVDVLVDGKLRARRRGILVSAGATTEVNLELVGAGTVTGTVFAPSGEALSSNIIVTLTSLTPDIGGILTTTTSDALGGSYTFTDVPVGGFQLTARDNVQGFLGEVNGRGVAADGETVNVNIDLLDNAVTFGNGIDRDDGNDFQYRIRADGALKNGLNLLFDASQPGAPILSVAVEGGSELPFVGANTGTEEDAGREIVTATDTLDGIAVHRKIAVPLGGYFARYLEVFENPGETALSVNAVLRSNINNRFNGFPRLVADSNDNGGADAGDLWIVTDDSADVDPHDSFGGDIAPVGFVLADGTGLVPDSVDFFESIGSTDGQLEVRYTFDVPAGERVILMHFVALQLSRAASQEAVVRLSQVPPEAIVGLAAEELGAITNFDMPLDGVSAVEPLPPLDGRIGGAILAADGVTKVGTATGTSTYAVHFQSDHPLYRRRRLQNVSSGNYRFAADLGAGFAIPRVDYTVDTSLTRFGETLSLVVPSGFVGAALVHDAPSVTLIPSSENGSTSVLSRAFDGNPATAWQTTSADTADTLELLASVPARVTEIEIIPHGSASLTDVRVDLFDAQGGLLDSQTESFPNGDDVVVLAFASSEPAGRILIDFDGATVTIAELSVRGDAMEDIGHALRDLVFAGTASIDVTVTRFDGTPESSTVSLIASGGTVSLSTGSSGRFFYAPVTANATPMTVAARAVAFDKRFLATSDIANLVSGDTAFVNLVLPETSSVSGTVFDGDGSAVGPQQVVLFADTGPGAPLSRTETTNGTTGQFTFDDVPSGDYRLRVIRNQATVIAPITVSAPAPVAQDIHLPVFGEVGVTVSLESAGPTNPPASGALVTLVDSLGRAHSGKTTNASGQIPSNFTNVPGGPFTLSVRHPSNFASITVDTSNVITSTGQLLVLAQVIPAFGTVNGTVLLGDGATGAAFADVDVSGVDVTPATDVADGAGSYQLTNVRAVRSLTLTAHHPALGREHITTQAQAQLSDNGQSLAVPMTLPKTGTVEVTVTDETSGNGIQGVNVSILDSFSAAFRSEGTTNSSGVRAINTVPEGSFTVKAELGQFVGEQTGMVTVHGDTVQISIVRPSDATVEGTVFAADGTSVVEDAPVELRSSDDTTLLFSTTTDATGLFRFTGALAPGTDALVRAFFPDDNAIETDTTVSATEAGQTLLADLTLDVSVIKGRVLESDGSTPVADAFVDLNPFGSNDLIPANVNADGSFLLFNEPEGRYELLVEDTFGLAGFATAELLPGELVVEQDVLLAEAGTVEGFVTDAFGSPLDQAVVELVNANVFRPRTAMPDASGFFRFERVAFGSFSLTYDQPTGDPGIVNPANAVGELTTAVPLATTSLIVPETGTVFGEVRDGAGVVLPANEGTFLTLEGREAETSTGIYSRTTDVDLDFVDFSQDGVPAGEVSAVAESDGDSGIATGTLAAGGSLELNPEMGTAVLLPYEPEPAATELHEVQSDGTLVGEADGVTGDEPFFGTMYVNQKLPPVLAAATRELAGEQVVFGPVRLAGVRHTRKVHVPAGATYARFIETFENPESIPMEVSLFLDGDIWIDSGFVTSSGDDVLDPTDTYFAGENADGTAVAFVFAGATSTRLPDVTGADSELYTQEWRRITIPAGGRVSLMVFAVQAPDLATAISRANTLTSLTGASSELSDLSSGERADIVNYDVP